MTPSLRAICGSLVAIGAGVAAVANASAADQVAIIRRGQAAVIQLEETPSSGYQWEIDRANGRNMSLVHVVDGGFRQQDSGKPPGIGSPGIHRWTIEAVHAGTAELSFVYRRAWERSPARSWVVSIRVDESDP
jgi:predicted secreted protein